MTRTVLWLSIVAWPLTAAAVQAAETAQHGAEHGPSVGTFWNALTTLITFGLVLWLLGKFVWPHVLRGLQDRENFIRESLASAKRDRQEAEELFQKYQAQIERARQEATAIVEEGRRDAENVRRKLHDDARQEADAILARARREIGIARDTAVKDLYTMAGDLATELASRILKREIDAKAHDRLIAESLDQLTAPEKRN